MEEAVVSFVIEQLGELIVKEGRFLSEVSDQLRRAQTDLQFMKAFLKDADVKQRNSETIRLFVVQTREAAYDLEDVIAACFVMKVGTIRTIILKGVRLYQIRLKLEDITTRISHLKRNLETYDLKQTGGATSSSSQDQTQQLRRTYPHVTEPNVVGVEDAVNELVGHLVKEEHRHRVVSISGMGGSGKSTIANQVYHHKEVKAHFNCRAWVCISQQYQVRDVLERIYVELKSPTKEEREEFATWKDDELPGRLARLLNEMKCLIVLDDIWTIETWNLLKAAFKCDDDSKSRILLTTRNVKVALHADENGFHYQPPPLNETHSWELFQKIAMHGRSNCGTDTQAYTKMEELGKEMVRHCAGLPLAVNVLAGLLTKKYTVEDWRAIQENVNVYISRGVGGHGEEQNCASCVLALSYDDLPYHLKPCFLYLGLFPEDHEIQVKTLTQLWIAEGFISLTQVTQQQIGFGEAMEDVAYNWLNELVDRCVIQVGKKSSIVGRIKTCRMHDLLRDLCLLKAKEANFLRDVKCCYENDAPAMNKIRRLAIYLDRNDEKMVPSVDEKSDHLRSLLVFGPNDDWFPKRKELISFMFSKFKFLKVLRVEGMRGRQVELPSEIGKMVHLRFLSLKNSDVISFPRFLGKLIFLQTLDFRVRSYNIQIPNVISKMIRLRHLYLPQRAYASGGVLRLSTLGSLQTLYNVSNTICDLNDLTKLGDLRKLRLTISSPSKDLEKIIDAAGSVLNGIRSLCLINKVGVECSGVVTRILARCCQIYKLKLSGEVQELPKEFHSYSKLTKLTLHKCRLKGDQLAKLKELPNLQKGYTLQEY